MKIFSGAATADVRAAEPASASAVSGAAPQGIIGVLVSLMAEADGFRFDVDGAVFEPDNAPLWDQIAAFPDVCFTPPEALSAGDDIALKTGAAACAEVDPGPAWPWLEATVPAEPEAAM